MLYIVLILAILILAAVSIRFVAYKREVRAMAEKVDQLHTRHSNERLTVQSQQKDIVHMANAVNQLYDDIYEERAQQTKTVEEIQQNMAGISHDLRTPLTSILGYMKLLQRGGNSPEQIQHYLDVVYGKAESMNRLVSSLFELARLDSGAYPFEWEVLDINEVFSNELAGSYDMLSKAEKQPVVELYEGSLPVYGDAGAFARIFSNLLKNIEKHGAEDVAIRSQSGGNQVVVTFSNRAKNLKKEEVNRLFQRFYTADDSRSKEDTGLGLTIVKELTEQMHGHITASIDQEVLCFQLEWPLYSN